MRFLDQPPRFLFFTGKGGVGKTSIACATSVHLAAAGRRVLLVSTDPASNVGQVFGVTIGNRVTAIPAVERLWTLEIDPVMSENSDCHFGGLAASIIRCDSRSIISLRFSPEALPPGWNDRPPLGSNT